MLFMYKLVKSKEFTSSMWCDTCVIECTWASHNYAKYMGYMILTITHSNQTFKSAQWDDNGGDNSTSDQVRGWVTDKYFYCTLHYYLSWVVCKSSPVLIEDIITQSCINRPCKNISSEISMIKWE